MSSEYEFNEYDPLAWEPETPPPPRRPRPWLVPVLGLLLAAIVGVAGWRILSGQWPGPLSISQSAIPPSLPVAGGIFTQRWEYDANGNGTARTDANGAVTRYDYDALDRLIAIRYPDGSKVSHAYDPRGRRTEMRDSLGTTRYKYDDLDRLIEVTDANGNTMKYEYDPADNLTALVYPNGQRVAYQYDAQGRLEKVNDPAGTTAYGYNEAYQMVNRTLPNGIAATFTYDAAGRLVGIDYRNRAGRTLMAFSYTLDSLGNPLQTVQTLADGRKLTSTYSYDELSRLTQVTHHPDGRILRYRYDQAGNRLEMIGPEGAVAYDYDAQGRLLRAGSTTFRYDANGNRVEKREGDKVTQFRYDYEDRLIEVDDGEQMVRFAYDGDGTRLRKSVDGAVSKYTYDLSGPLAEIVAEVGADGRWVRYPLGWERLGEIGTQAGNRFYLTDRLGSVVGVTDPGGELLQTYSYDPFGTPLQTTVPTSRSRAPGLALSLEPPPQDAHLTENPNVGALAEPTPRPIPSGPSFGFGAGKNEAAGLVHAAGRDYAPSYGWWQRLPGTAAGEYAVQFYTDLIATPNTNVWVKRGAWAGLFFSSLWTRETAWKTTAVLGGGYAAASGLGYTTLGEHLLVKGALLGSKAEPFHLPIVEKLIHYGIGKFGPHIGIGLGGETLLHIYQTHLNIGGPRGLDIGGYIYPTLPSLYERGRDYLSRAMARSEESRGSRQPPSKPGTELVFRQGFPKGCPADPSKCPPPPMPPCPAPFCGGGGGGGGGGAPVGGVLLDKAAEVLVDINTITGATYDPATGQLILLGQQDRRLPAMNMEDLVVAIRAAYMPVGEKDGALLLEAPGVSIDPLDPRHPEVRFDQMAVTYSGRTEGTAFGQVMFQADRFLKSASLGKDNRTGQDFSTRVPGYKSLLDLWKTYPQNRACPEWHRMWFFINQVRLKETADGRSMVFDQSANPVRVEARFVKWENGRKVDVPCSDPAVDAFVQHFNQHYDEFAQEEPALLKLQQLARVVAVVHWLRENKIPLDLSWVNRYRAAPVDTPKTTRAVTATSSLGNVTQLLYGGVDFSLAKGKNLRVDTDEGGVAPNARAAVASRPDDVAIAWNVAVDGQALRAVALNLAPAPVIGGYSTLESDLSLAARGTWPLELNRGYNSIDPSPGPMGHGWTVAPFTLRDERSLVDQAGRPYNMYARMVGADGTSTAFDVMRLWTPEKEVGPVTPPASRDSVYLGIARVVEAGQTRYRVWREELSQRLFDAQGQLLSQADSSGNAISYHYNAKGQLEAIVGPDGSQRITLAYDSQGRLMRAKASAGQEVSYRYDAAGGLSEVGLPGNRRLTYSYDAAHRLISQALNGHTLFQNSYDELGRLVKQVDGAGRLTTAQYDRRTGQAVFTDQAGSRFQQTYDATGRMLTTTDPQGNTTTYGYDAQDNLTSIKDPRGNTSRLEYDARGWLVGRVDPLGQKWEILRGFADEAGNEAEYELSPGDMATKYTYDSRRRLIAVQDGLQVKRTATGISSSYNPAQARLTTFQYDATGLLLGYQRFGLDRAGKQAPIGSAIMLRYDDLGRVRAIQREGQVVREYSYDDRDRVVGLKDSLGYAVTLTYDDADHLATVSTTAGKVSYAYDELGQVVQITDPVNRRTHYQYDSVGNLIRVTEANGAVTGYEYDAVGNLVAVIDAIKQRTNYEYDALGRLVQETIVVPAGTR